MSRLTDNLNSQYLDAANRLKPSRKGRTVVAYVESYDDVWFWRSVLQEFETPELRFQVMLPSHGTLQRGKKSALANLMEGERLGKSMIACVDADYDYLMQGATSYSRTMLENPFVVHTQVYAIENYQCYAEGLREACVMATLNDHEILDLGEFMHQYSRIIWPLFVWSIWAYRYDHFKLFSMTDLARLIAIHDVNIEKPVKELQQLQQRVNSYLNVLYRRFPEGKKTYAELKDELQGLGAGPDNCYLYIQGHMLFEGVVLPLLVPVCARLRRERENAINRQSVHETQRQNELSCYQHSTQRVEDMLKKGNAYRALPEYEKVREQIRCILSRKETIQ